ncbi:GNAT family N-acetyltransferase [Candidatus Xianfuyuplasma coldseepsis]|uniref:GNAT family N-acetyltransferase n=1 Tax=Candidatus Xianfuyuplasma coldseepsis TaxID=2782163 RepID=A0A7L7KNM6_9MOLU|nr:GNAT family N-acetyltransferase [Xianfuyuplasma coldseepsis]QMS84237.1 GNAT family N-acetyltransferase [Xianfuyuplasma coldseepsis]
MNFTFKPLTMDDVTAISLWRYDGFMKSIYMQPYIDNYAKTNKIIGPEQCDGYAVFVENTLFGLFEYYLKGPIIELGLAIHPDYVGKGFSNDFIDAGINFAVWRYDYDQDYVQLTVEKDNIAAFKAYKKNGFVEVEQKDHEIVMYKYL